MALSRIFGISSRSLSAYQYALNVTAHNISNANNTNYTRQKVVLGEEKSDRLNNFTFGSGVKVDDIVRVKNQITETQIRNYNQSYSFSEKQAAILGNLESLLSEPSDLGLSGMMNSFFNSWSELAVNPTSMQLRTNVVQSAQKMTEKLRSIYQDLNNAKTDLKSEATENVKQINSLVAQIQRMNKDIFEAKVSGDKPNDLMDERDAAINELSKLANINVSFDQNGSANITIGGVFAVDQIHYTQFKVEEEDGELTVKTSDGAVKLNITNGAIGAVVKSFSENIPKYLSKLDTIATAIFTSVNSFHVNGSTTHVPPQTNVKFFESYENGNLKINSDIINDPNYIAISQDGTNGNSYFALKIAELKDARLIDNQTLSEVYAGFASDIGNEVSFSEQNTESYGLVLTQLENQKASYSGVSIDEEMTNVIKYQRSFDAAAKLIKIADEITQTIISIVG